METLEKYLERKGEEIALLNGCLSEPLDFEVPKSVAAVIDQKFRLAAALKAEHAAHEWKFTETNWAHAGRRHTGPFRFKFDYQRADLSVQGPAIYNALSEGKWALTETTYTSSGMAAISSFLMALERLTRRAALIALPGSYSETLELVENFGRNVRLRCVSTAEASSRLQGGGLKCILLDSCLPRSSFVKLLQCPAALFDLILFDTSCFSTDSANIRRVLNWAGQAGIPVVLIRSHTKLDSLGVEYGRLGSAVSVTWPSADKKPSYSLEALTFEMRKAVRLFGGAAVPAHFPPFAGTSAFRSLSARRLAAIIRNNRRMASRLTVAFPRSDGQLEFAHSLYLTLTPDLPVGEHEAKQIADNLCSDLSRKGLPIRHAGSFGFDFAAAEWFRDTLKQRDVVRIAMSDLPSHLADTIATEIIRWWRKHEVGSPARETPDLEHPIFERSLPT